MKKSAKFNALCCRQDPALGSLQLDTSTTMKRHYRLLLLILLLSCCLEVAFAGKFRKNKQAPIDDDEEVDVPQVHYLVEYLGKEMYNYINRPKYRFYVYMALGRSLPDEQSTIAMISTVCNVLYGITVFFGFMLLRRDYMLLITILTLYIGPAIVLILIALVGASLAAFALYPVYSVLAMWTFFFLTSQVAQALGKYLGLDADKDGDVDMLDFVYWASTTKVGKFVGLPGIYTMLNECTRDPFQEITRRLDALAEKVQSINNSPQTSPNKSATKKGNGDSPSKDEYHS